jgi:hypothetical protein
MHAFAIQDSPHEESYANTYTRDPAYATQTNISETTDSNATT